MPLAYIAGGSVYYVHPDHLNTPQRVTDATAAVVWDADYRPFGEATVSGALTFNLRFPGQYADAETGLRYNYFRDYDAGTGRYIQSDPIGLQGGWNTYAYVGGNPVILVDPRGLAGNPNAQKRASSSCGALEWAVVAANGFGMMWENVIGNDKYYHCLANCELAEMGPRPEKCAVEIFTKRERDFMERLNSRRAQMTPEDYAKNVGDSQADERANRFGRWQGRTNREDGCLAMPCKESCSRFYPGYEPG